MSIIKNKDIYDPSQGNPLQPILDVLELMDKKILESANVMKKLESALRGVQNTGTGAGAKELTEATEKLNKETQKLIATEKAKEQIEKQLALQEAKFIELQNGKAAALAEIKIKTQQLNKEEAEKAKLASKNISLYDKESATLNKLRKEYKELALQNKENTREGKALLANIQQLDAKLKRVDASVGQFQRNVGNYTSALSKFGAGLKNLFVGGGIIAGITLAFSKLSAFASSALELGSQLSGTQRAFDQLNNPKLLDNLRAATGGTITDLELMKKVLDADDFKVDLNNLPLYFAYARKEVQETGGSVTELVGKLINGIGKESKKVVTELGITTKDFNEQLKKTPDYVDAVNAIIKDRMSQAGTYIETAADVTARWSARWDNFKASAGGVIDKVLTTISPVLEDIWNWLGKLWDRGTSFLLDFINGWITLYNESLPFRTAIEAIQLTFTSLFETVKLFFNFFIDNLKLTGKLIAYTFNPKNWGAGFGKGLTEVLASSGAEVITDIKRYGKNIGNAFADGLKDSRSGKLNLLSKSDFSFGTPGGSGNNNNLSSGTSTGTGSDGLKNAEINSRSFLQKNQEFLDFREAQAQEAMNAELEADEAQKQQLLDNEASLMEARLELYNEDYERKKEFKEKEKALIDEIGEYSGIALGQFLASGELSMKEFAKMMLDISLRALENSLLFAITEIWFKQVSEKGFLGIPTAAILTGLVKGVFAGIRAKISGFAEGTDFINGPGTGTSDSVLAKVSRGEGVLNAKGNKELMKTGMRLNDPNLPSVIMAGLNFYRMEKILSNVNQNTSITAQYLSNGVSSWQDAQYRYYRDNKTGLTHRISLYGN